MKSQLALYYVITGLLTLPDSHFTLAMTIGDDSRTVFDADERPRMYLNTQRPAVSNGTVSTINYCYYGPSEISSGSYQSLVAIYRPFNSNRNYRRVSDTLVFGKRSRDSDDPIQTGYNCDSYQLEQSVQVQVGDVFGACIEAISGKMPLLLVSRSDEFGYFMRLTDAENIPECADGVLPEVVDNLSSSGRRRILHVFAEISDSSASPATLSISTWMGTSTSSLVTLATDQPSVDSNLFVKVGSSVGVASGVILLIVLLLVIILVLLTVYVRQRKRNKYFSERVIPHGDSTSNLVGDYRSETFHAAAVLNNPACDFSCHYERAADVQSEQNDLSTSRSVRQLTSRRFPKANYLTSQNSHYQMQVLSTLSRNTYHDYSILEGPNCSYDELVEKNVNEDIYENVNPFVQPAKEKVDLYAQIKSHGIQNIDQSSIETSDYLGSGQFGTVERGILRIENYELEVALKTLNSSTTEEDQLKFLQEAAIMTQFRHPNVVLIYGIVCKSEEITMVAELVEKGDLRKYLLTLRPRSDELPDHHLPSLLLSFSQHVALGMQYLSSKGFIHRDLAARNVLVSKDNMCKIADFGMSRDLADEKYYVSNGGIIPIKWTAPEAIHYKKYSTASDVWSYGCLLYEIWSLGHKPYENISNIQAVRYVNKGKRLSPPPGCPQLVYDLMIQCWNPNKAERPNFRTMHLNLLDNGRNILSIPPEALESHSLAGVLGAPLTAGEGMFLELQKQYEEVAYYDII